MPATNITYTANFTAAATITVAASTNAGGSVTGSGIFFVGSNVLITASASNGWWFLGWNDGVTNNSRTIVVSSNMNYTALFAPTAVITVLASPTNGGRVTGGGTYVVGSNAVLTATASNFWIFTSWNDSVTNNPRTVVVPSGGWSYTANFGLRDSVGDGIPDWWRAQYFGGDGTTNNASSCATRDFDNDGLNNLAEYLAGTDPTNAVSRLAIINITIVTNDVLITWIGGTNAWQAIECNSNLTDTNAWSAIFTNSPPTTVTNTLPHPGAGAATKLFYRIKAWR
ncbi:MAG: hypothetical protein NTY53_23770 [Kiritimatiellaeota bacterium]|nr:hypothetical protein [Kiritimatiellota bacterium]